MIINNESFKRSIKEDDPKYILEAYGVSAQEFYEKQIKYVEDHSCSFPRVFNDENEITPCTGIPCKQCPFLTCSHPDCEWILKNTFKIGDEVFLSEHCIGKGECRDWSDSSNGSIPLFTKLVVGGTDGDYISLHGYPYSHPASKFHRWTEISNFSPSTTCRDLQDFPKKGYVRSIHPDIIHYLRSIFPLSDIDIIQDDTTILAWSSNGFWQRKISSNQPEYTEEEILNYIHTKGSKLDHTDTISAVSNPVKLLLLSDEDEELLSLSDNIKLSRIKLID